MQAVACALLISGLLGACSVSAPLAVTSSGAGLDAGQTVALGQGDDPTDLRGRFQSALTNAFAQTSIDLTDDAPVFADFSVSLTKASDGIVSGKGPSGDAPEEPDWLAEPRLRGNFDKCKAQRVRASLVLYDRASGNVIYRGTGQATECNFSNADIAAIAQSLVDDARAQSGR